MRTQHKPAREAATQAMQEVSGPVVAIVLTLCAVFIPVSFLGGLAGELYRQFAVTIAVSVVIAGIVALTPALAALLLEQEHKEPASLFRVLNRGFAWLTFRYTGVVECFLKRTFISVGLGAAMLGATGDLFTKVQAGSYRRKTKVMC